MTPHLTRGTSLGWNSHDKDKWDPNCFSAMLYCTVHDGNIPYRIQYPYR